MSRRILVAIALHRSYANLRNVPEQWQKFVARVMCHAEVMAWE
jgi:hypothetical protein